MPPSHAPSRIRILNLQPTIEGGHFPVKRSSGEVVRVSADLVRDGHEVVRAALQWEAPGQPAREVPMRPDGPDRWWADITMTGLGWHRCTVRAWVDPFASWRSELERKVAAGQRDLDSELAEGAALVEGLVAQLPAEAAERARRLAASLAGSTGGHERAAAALAPDLLDIFADPGARAEPTETAPFEIDVDRERARVGVWYELFPRSFGGLRGVAAHLPRLAELGVDVVYLPPIHPIGMTHRKGRNNAPVAEPGDVGSPWAIGGPEGGHTAIHPDLGTDGDFDALIAAADRHGVEIALDFAIQCSPDHPWLTEHPQWFHRRPDGTLKYAENPPKRYQDIYNVNWAGPDWRNMWEALRQVVLHWVGRGVRIFRVDNPHTKPIGFWEWLIRRVRRDHPEVIFLAEAFTSPARMYALAQAGFSQSYTYFTWKNGRDELLDYVEELSRPPAREVFRPNFFANTPDILHEYLQYGGRAAFVTRLVLAATLSPTYGIYSGFENVEHTPVAAGSEEYLDSEKYETKDRRLDGELLPLFARLNAIRREEAPLRRINVRRLETRNDALLAVAKGWGQGTIIVCANLDPHSAQEGVAHLPHDLGLPERFAVRDLLSGAVYHWGQGDNYIRLDPHGTPAHLLRVEW